MNSRIIASGVITLTVMASLAAAPVMANSGDDHDFYGYGYRPGWGFGDKNHIHSGPPGHDKSHPNGNPPGQANKDESGRGSSGNSGSSFGVSTNDDDDRDEGKSNSKRKGKKKGW